jgi:hypothetical protein
MVCYRNSFTFLFTFIYACIFLVFPIITVFFPYVPMSNQSYSYNPQIQICICWILQDIKLLIIYLTSYLYRAILLDTKYYTRRFVYAH